MTILPCASFTLVAASHGKTRRSAPIHDRTGLGVLPIGRLARYDEVAERLGIGTELAGVLRSIGIEPMVAVSARRAEQAGPLDRTHVHARTPARRRLDTEPAQHGRQATRSAWMVRDQGRDLTRIDPDVTEDPVQLAGFPELREFGAQGGASPDLADRARQTRSAATDQCEEPVRDPRWRFRQKLAHGSLLLGLCPEPAYGVTKTR